MIRITGDVPDEEGSVIMTHGPLGFMSKITNGTILVVSGDHQ